MRTSINIDFAHIYGHQDQKVFVEDLERKVQMNVECDGMAQQFLDQVIECGGEGHDVLPHEIIVVRVNGQKVIGDIGPQIRDAVGRKLMMEHLSTTKVLHGDAFNYVDWDSVEVTMRKYPQQLWLWVTKQCSGFCAINAMMHWWGRTSSNFCPCCGAVCETAHHLMHCTEEARLTAFQDDVEELRTWMTKHQTEPVLVG